MRKRMKLREVPVGTDVTFENGVTVTMTEERLLGYLFDCRDTEVWVDVPDTPGGGDVNLRTMSLEQWDIKSSMGITLGAKAECAFHWKFWKPLKLDCGGWIWFGFYVVYDRDEVQE